MTITQSIPIHRSYGRHLLRASVIISQIIGAVGLAIAPSAPAAARNIVAAPDAGSVTGRVFRDYNANGTRDPNEPGIADVTVTAVTSGGTFTGTTNTAGIYTINVAAGDAARVQATVPANFQSGPVGPNSGTTVRFVNVTGAVANIDFGMFVPSDYCQPNPFMATGCAIYGDAVVGENNAEPNFYTFPYDSAGNADPGVNPTTHSTFNQSGSLYGLAYHRASKRIFAGAYLKRLVSFVPGNGTDGSGKIYLIDPAAAAGVTVFADLDALLGGDATGSVALRDWDWDLANGLDKEAFAKVGKMSLGDLELSDDEKTLYVVNLADRSLYAIPVGSVPGVIPTAPAAGAITKNLVPDPGCANGVGRPFGLKAHNGLIYVGGVCTAETGGTAADMKAYVYSFNPATGTFSAAPVIQFPLNYSRGCANVGVEYAPVECRIGVNGSKANWYPWSDVLIPAPGFAGGWTAEATTAYPQPILADIEFVGETMIIGLRDRFADQIGSDEPGPDANITGPATPLIRAVPAGDILRAAKTGATWTLEADPSEAGEFYQDEEIAPGGANTHDERSFGALTYLPGAPDIAMTGLDAAGMFAPPQIRRFGSSGIVWMNNTTGAYTRAFEVYEPDPAGKTITLRKANGLGDIELLCDSAPIEIGNRVWQDSNRDGIQDPGEPPLAGVTVRLSTSTGAEVTAVTDANGEYYFSSAAGTTTASRIYGLSGVAAVQLLQNTAYTVSVATAQAAIGANLLTVPTVGSNTAIDSNGLLIGPDAVAKITTGDAGANDHTIDFGFAPPPPLAALGDFVWRDDNRNGLQDQGEPGVPNVTVQLFNSDKILISTTVTSAAGTYLFPDLIPDTYSVCFVPASIPAGSVFTTPNAGADDAVDSDADAITGCTAQTYTLVAGQTNLTVDAGIFIPAQLGDLVWRDNNSNGLQDNGEPGVPGVTVQLRNAGGTVISTTTTDANGNYLFPGLLPGTYSVCFQPPAGTQLTTPNTGANDAIDSDALANGCTGTYTLVAGESNLTVDAGIVPIAGLPAQLGDLVWRDNNSNGVQDAGEPGVPGVTVQLRDNTGTVISTTVTDANGLYLFPNLPPGTYSVCFQPPAGTQLTTPNTGADDAVDSDALASGCTGTYTLVAGESNLTVDAGIVPIPPQLARLGDFVWRDNDKDGVQDAGEPGVSGVTVTLRNSGGVVISTTTTDSSGHYLFPDLPPGTYSVCFGVPAGYDRSPVDQGGNDAADSDASQTTGCTGTYTLVAGESNLTVDAGLTPQSPLLAIVKSSQPVPGTRVKTGDRIDYTLIISNTGDGTATNVIVTDPIPTGTTYVVGSAVPALQSGPDPLVWNIGSLAPSQSKSVTFAVIVQNADNSVTAVINVAGVSSDQTPKVPSNQVVHPFSPTAISLVGFAAVPTSDGVKISWSTSLELNSFGFELARGESDDQGSTIKVSPMIQAIGRNGGANYSFVDTTAQPNKAYRYWLVETETGGSVNYYGPAVVPVTVIPAQTVAQQQVVVVANNGAVGGGDLMVLSSNATQGSTTPNVSLGGTNSNASNVALFDKPAQAVKAETILAQSQNAPAQGAPAQVVPAQNAPVAVEGQPKQADLVAFQSGNSSEANTVAAPAQAVQEAVAAKSVAASVANPEAAVKTQDKHSSVAAQPKPKTQTVSNAPITQTVTDKGTDVSWLLLLVGSMVGGLLFVSVGWVGLSAWQRKRQ